MDGLMENDASSPAGRSLLLLALEPWTLGLRGWTGTSGLGWDLGVGLGAGTK